MTKSSEQRIGKSIRQNPRLNSGALLLLRECVQERTGLYFDDSRRDLFFDKLSPLIDEWSADSLMDYYYFLKYDTASVDEWKKVFDALTVQESFFWREMDQIRVLVDRIVPQYFADHPNETLNIWSAACAGGEEPLTIAMALEDAGWFDRQSIHIHASDASPRAIEASQRGLYRERSFRNLPAGLREKYFVRANDGLSKISDDLHSRIRWQLTNLISEADLSLAPVTSPVIFCRNVFIYFSDNAARKTVRSFAGQMSRPGYLFLGMAESLLQLTSDFELREIGDSFVYVKC